MIGPTTLCWNCGAPYPSTAIDCPGCGAANGTLTPDKAISQALSRATDSLQRIQQAATLHVRLKAFVTELLCDEWRFPDGADVDGGSLQDLCVKHGVLLPVAQVLPCNTDDPVNIRCQCLEAGGLEEFPLTCYRLPDWLIAVRAEMRKAKQEAL
jgi:hypothetical protein